jgi:hypothetical protein
VQALHAAGFSVQLSHDPTEKGTFRDPHGFVAILEDGKELARDESFQHNVSFHDRDDKVEELMAQVHKKRTVATAAAGAVEANTVVASATSAAAAL